MTFRGALRDEWLRIWRHPADTLGTVLINAVLMISVWFLLPREWLFSWTGTFGFVLALAGWMYADVTASNVLAPDSDRVLAVLDDPRALRTLLSVKAVALWSIVAPISGMVAIGIGIADGNWAFTALVLAVLFLLPFGPLALTGLVGIAFPYHQKPLRWRWEHRAQRRQVIVRWGILLVIPYVVLPSAVGVVVIVPALCWRLVVPVEERARIATGNLALCVFLAVAISGAAWFIAHWIALRWVRRHSEGLRAYLAEPDRG